MQPSSDDNSTSHYSFGDSQRAALRLEYLAAAFEASSRSFLQRAKPERVELAVDLGSALGLTTALVHGVTNASRVVGYERSANFLTMARLRYPHLTFREVDVLSVPYPDREADLIYSRFLLTHLHRPDAVLRTCVEHLRSGGRVLLEETAEMLSPVPALAHYYTLVEQLQAHHGQEMLIGKRLGAIATDLKGARTDCRLEEIPVAANTMARLHALNLATWKADPFMLETQGLPALQDLEDELKEIAGSSTYPNGRCVMAQVCMERL